MLIASITWATIPMISVLADGDNDPFMLQAAYSLGGLISRSLYLLFFHITILKWSIIKTFLPSKKTFFTSLSNAKHGNTPNWNWQIIVTLPNLGIGLYAWATIYIPEVVAAVLLESWPILSLFLLMKLFPEKQKFVFNLKNTFLISAVFTGVAAVIFSGNAEIGQDLWSIDYDTAIGVSLIAVQICLIGFGAYRFKWASIASHAEIQQDVQVSAIVEKQPDAMKAKSETGYLILSTVVGSIASGLLGLGFSVFSSGSLGWNNFWVAFAGGMTVTLIGTLADAYGILRSKNNVSVQSIRFLTPVFAVGFLWAISHLDNVKTGLFSLGLATIVAGNFLIHTGARAKQNLKSMR